MSAFDRVLGKNQGVKPKMVVTKADVYEKVIFAERPVCPHCGKEMKISECHDTGLFHVGRGGVRHICLFE